VKKNTISRLARDKKPVESVTVSSANPDFATVLGEIRRLYATGEVEAALDLAGRLPQSAAPIERNAVPQVTMSSEALLALPLDHRGGFMLTRIDGVLDVQGVIDVSGMEDTEAIQLIEKLVALGALTLTPKGQPDATISEDRLETRQK
jgi:hypothetical protein